MGLTIWILLSLQLAMGAFDTLYHHELTERLAWRQSQRTELKLHGVRNLFYGVVFLGLAVSQPQGALALAMIGILAIEMLITLKDFVEEDATRRLPASERITHTLMALNYGAILAFLIPLLWTWSALPIGFVPVWYGAFSLLAILAALGVSVFGIRDLRAARRLARMAANPVNAVLPKAVTPKTILITGGTGFIGSELCRALGTAGHELIVLTRNAAKAAEIGAPVKAITDLSQIHDTAKIDAIINLAGQPVAGGLWTKSYRAKIMDSRIVMTRKLITLMERLTTKPEALINGSAIGVYGCQARAPHTETSLIETDKSFAQELCQTWEAEAVKAKDLGVRTALLRIGIVLGTEGGSAAQMLVPTELGGGAILGDGTQMMSWISLRDTVRLIAHVLDRPDIDGPVNVTAPNPASNAQFMRILANALYRPTLVRIPNFVFTKWLGGLGTEIFLGSQNIYPQVALDSGFGFQDPDLKPAIYSMVGRGGKPRNAAIAKDLLI